MCGIRVNFTLLSVSETRVCSVCVKCKFCLIIEMYKVSLGPRICFQVSVIFFCSLLGLGHVLLSYMVQSLT